MGIAWMFLLVSVAAAAATTAASSSTSEQQQQQQHQLEVWGTPEQCGTHDAACFFKAPNPQTPRDVLQKWHEQDTALWSFVEEQVPDVLEHTGTAAFDEHLKGVQAVLRYWKAPDHLTKSGLFHSIYGTEGFQGFALPLYHRTAIQSLIGKEAEKLAFVFCMVDRYTFDQTVLDYYDINNGSSTAQNSVNDTSTSLFQLRSRPELGRFTMELTKEEWLDFVELTLADWMEQVQGAAEKPSELFLWKTGEAYAYRRLVFRRMSQILAVERGPRLATIPTQMLHTVMETEGEATRQLLQPRTPPMSQAAADALAALRAVGEGDDIPMDLSPQPMPTMQRDEL